MLYTVNSTMPRDFGETLVLVVTNPSVLLVLTVAFLNGTGMLKLTRSVMNKKCNICKDYY